VRDFLQWAGAQRRGSWVVWWIRSNLKKVGLATEPDFQSAYLDSPIRFVLRSPPSQSGSLDLEEVPSTATIPVLELSPTTGPSSTIYADPTYRISKLAAANNTPISVTPDATVQQASTVMLANDFSQLPVMTNERDVKGIISWASIGTRLALAKGGPNVRHFMDSHQEIRLDSSLFQAIPIIAQHQYVLVRANDGRITGIVTGSDLNLQFQQLAEPFLLLDEIENHIRRLLSERYTITELASVRDPKDSSRTIDGVEDLTFGEYIRLIESDERWKKIEIQIDRVTFCNALDRVRSIRNDVMHFDPDGIPPADLERLRDFAGFLRKLQTIGAF
jgi:hypothetical protein